MIASNLIRLFLDDTSFKFMTSSIYHKVSVQKYEGVRRTQNHILNLLEKHVLTL